MTLVPGSRLGPYVAGGALATGLWTLPASNEGKGSRSALARFPDTGGRWQLAEDSAVYSRWTRGGREIVYLAFDTAHATALPVDLSGRAPRFGAPQRLFPDPTLSINGNTFDVTPDGERFLFVVPIQDARPTPYTLILNWERLLEQER